MGKKIIEFIFFGNYFVGLLAIALSIESAMELDLRFDTWLYFGLIFCAVTFYYTYAYTNADAYKQSNNLRTKWYIKNRNQTKWSQRILLTATLCILSIILIRYYRNIFTLSSAYWIAIFIILIAAVLYYGLLPKSVFKYNLRNTGWAKAFVIGFEWACCANVLPLIMLKIQDGTECPNPYLCVWLFINNWLFCTVNAIMFDIKDYPTDANLHLRTFVVRFGLRNTIYYILIPLSVAGLMVIFIFACIQHFTLLQLFFNTLPFPPTIYLAYALHKRKSTLFYLITIDGLIMFKAICGIIATQFIT